MWQTPIPPTPVTVTNLAPPSAGPPLFLTTIISLASGIIAALAIAYLGRYRDYQKWMWERRAQTYPKFWEYLESGVATNDLQTGVSADFQTGLNRTVVGAEIQMFASVDILTYIERIDKEMKDLRRISGLNANDIEDICRQYTLRLQAQMHRELTSPPKLFLSYREQRIRRLGAALRQSKASVDTLDSLSRRLKRDANNPIELSATDTSASASKADE